MKYYKLERDNIVNNKEKIVCSCGESYYIQDLERKYYKSPLDDWLALAGREYYFWNCKKCDKSIFRQMLRMN